MGAGRLCRHPGGSCQVLVAPHIPFNFVPNTSTGVMQISVRNPPGTPLEVTNDNVGAIEKYLSQQPEVETVQSIIGSSPNGLSGLFSGNNTGSITVQLTPIGKRKNIFELIPPVSQSHSGSLP